MSTQNHAAGPLRVPAGNTNRRSLHANHQPLAGISRAGRRPFIDPAERVALVVESRRQVLLNVHRHKLRREDLEDCLSQAALELVVRVRQGVAVASDTHLARMLEQRFTSRINDKRRAIEGRSAAHAGFEQAMSGGLFDGAEEHVADPRAEVEPLVLRRLELSRLRELATQLTADQRLVLRSQLDGIECAELCSRLGWSAEKYRKVAQRARARLRLLLDSDGGFPAP